METSKDERIWATTWTTYGKWILTGEHSVLRGAAALVFPLRDRKMEFQFNKSKQAFTVEFMGECGEELKLIFWGLLEEALKRVQLKREDIMGHLQITSDLPLGAGLGASAALCVGVSRLFKNLGLISEEDLFEFSRSLENLFHGESSGVDIAVALSGEPLKFYREQGRLPLSVRWKPQLYISYCGKKGVTSECVKKVTDLKNENPKWALELDSQMQLASEMAERSLSLDAAAGLPLLAKAIQKANQVFVDWGLADGAMGKHLSELREQGAVAVKPTGSGDGGYVLSLWAEAAPPAVTKFARPLFN